MPRSRRIEFLPRASRDRVGFGAAKEGKEEEVERDEEEDEAGRRSPKEHERARLQLPRGLNASPG